ncbi:hypothetical protein K8P02_03955 [Bacteroides nordii]|uniref:serine dehydratase beta chain n=1 Tax=Bacteroides nordii TaxID=291645 RepID=UPI0004710E5A|nr:hypothetical protein K8P02_03955 [Bacteroides nordii]
MKTIKEIDRIGVGPSSSHTIGPKIVAERFLAHPPQAKSFKVTEWQYETMNMRIKSGLIER